MMNLNLQDQIRELSRRVRASCYSVDPSLHRKVRRSEFSPPPAPPLSTTCELLGQPLEPLLLTLYDNDVDFDQVNDGWEQLVQLQVDPIGNRTEALKLLRQVFPRAMHDADDVYDVMALFLGMTSFTRRFLTTLYSRASGVELVQPYGRWSLTRRDIRATSGNYHREVAEVGSVHKKLVAYSGKTKSVKPQLLGAYRYMVDCMPAQEVALKLLYSIAAAGGRDAQDAFIGSLDIVVVAEPEEAAKVTRAWARALDLIDQSTENPARSLLRILAPAASRAQLLDAVMLFDPTAPFTPSKRKGLKDSVMRLRAELTGTTPEQEAKRLLELHETLKG